MIRFFTIDPAIRAKFEQNLAKKLGPELFQKTEQEYSKKVPYLKTFKPYFYEKVAKFPLESLLKLNQSVAEDPPQNQTT